MVRQTGGDFRQAVHAAQLKQRHEQQREEADPDEDSRQHEQRLVGILGRQALLLLLLLERLLDHFEPGGEQVGVGASGERGLGARLLDGEKGGVKLLLKL